MNKKIIFTILIIIIVIGGIYLWQKNQQNQSPIENNSIEQIPTGTTNGINNFQLLEIAKQHVLSKPQLYLNRDKFVAWDDYNEIDSSFSKATPEWIISQKSDIRYIEPNKYPAPHDNLNDKYIVSWFFIPRCEENPSSNNKPNWFDKKGRQCVGGYQLSVMINPNETIDYVALDALD
ncbi:hypothetical protein J7J13_01385 [bacterium]|nr:hypothetical protein [bacterium]